MYLDEVAANGSLTRLVEHSPQLPQGFNPVKNLTFWPGQNLQATCDFNSSERSETTYAGATHHNEMCNLYMIMWSELPVFWSCHGNWLANDLHGAGISTYSALLQTQRGVIVLQILCFEMADQSISVISFGSEKHQEL